MRKSNNSIWTIILVTSLIAINLIASYFHQRFDLTQEKRYSLSKPTKNLLRNLDGPVRIEVFMKGEFPAGFKKLANSVDEFLQECKEYGGANIQYEFIDPFAGLDDSLRRRVIDSIAYSYNIPALTLQAPGKVGDEQTEKLVLPGAIIHYKDTAIGVNLLEGQKSFGTEPEQLAALYNNVEASMEYKFASAIQKVTTNEKPRVAYALGNGEGWGYNVNDAVTSLIRNYNFDTVNISQTPFIAPFDALVILKPTVKFSDADKFKIDQYVMHGGRVFWMIDNVYSEFDSLYKSQGFIAFDRGLNLEDILFNYGARINQSLLQDMQCDKLPQISTNGTGQRRVVDWPFFPVLNGTSHPISKNLDGVRSMFPTTLDTVEATGIKKTYILESSNNARILDAPARIDFSFLQIAPDIKLFKSHHIPVGLLLEGKFNSLYSGRTSTTIKDSMAAHHYPFLSSCEVPGKMIIISDGDIAVNPYSPTTGPLEMGRNEFIGYTYANKEFFLNCMDYLVNPTDILQTRSKEYTLRLLDPIKVTAQRSQWQVINIVLPILVMIIFGSIYQQIRKTKFG